MRIVELAGIPGSGKSALVARLEDRGFLSPERALVLALRTNGPLAIKSLSDQEAKAQVDDLFRSCDLSRSFAAFWASHPELIAASSTLSRAHLDREERTYALSVVFTHCRLVAKLAADGPRDGILLLDEGLVQRAMTLGLPTTMESASEQSLAAYAMALPTPAGLILLRLDPEAALARLESRPGGPPRRMRGLDRKARLEFLARAGELLERTATQVAGPDLILVDAAQPLEKVTHAALAGLGRVGLIPSQEDAV